MAEEHQQAAGVAIEKATLHAVMHTVVENRLAFRDNIVMRTLDRLMADGLDRQDALHAVGSVLADHRFGIISDGTEESASTDKHYRALEEPMVASWGSSTSPEQALPSVELTRLDPPRVR